MSTVLRGGVEESVASRSSNDLTRAILPCCCLGSGSQRSPSFAVTEWAWTSLQNPNLLRPRSSHP